MLFKSIVALENFLRLFELLNNYDISKGNV